MDQDTTQSLSLASNIEALLFYKGEPEKVSALVKALGVAEEEITTALDELSESLGGRGISLMRTNDTVELRTAHEASALVEEVRKQELARDLGKAGAETLAIIVYRGPLTRTDIDYIRGVNSSFILRNLLIRGLIERSQKEGNARAFVYKPTVELLAHLGVESIESLPEYHVVQSELEKFIEEGAEGEPAPAGV